MNSSPPPIRALSYEGQTLALPEVEPRSPLELGQRRTRKTLPSLLATIACSVGLVLATSQDDPVMIVMGLVGLWVVWAGYALWKVGKQSVILPIYSAIHWFTYLFPIFSSDFLIRQSPVSTSAIRSAAELALAGQVLFSLGMIIAPVERIRPPAFLNVKVDFQASQKGLLLVALILSPIKVLLAFYRPPSAFAQLSSAIADFGMMAVAALFLLYTRGQLPLRMRFFTVSWIAMLFLVQLLSGFLALPLMSASVLIVLFLIQRRRIPYLAIAALALPVFLFSGIKTAYRRATWGDNARPTLNLVDSFSTIVTLSADSLAANKAEESVSDGRETFLKRADHLTAFGLVVELTPGKVPYWGGETYLTLFTSLIPRLFWPDKPMKTLGQDYGHRYGYLDPSDTYTSINLEQAVEMYANFGVWGVLLGMFTVGVIYRFGFSLLDVRTDTNAIITATIVPALMLLECDFSLVHGAIFQLVVLWLLLYHLCLNIGVFRQSSDTGNRQPGALHAP